MKFKIGDRVETSRCRADNYPVTGKPGRVTGFTARGMVVAEFDGKSHEIDQRDLVVSFEKGDRVEVIKNRTDAHPIVGNQGTVVNYTWHGMPVVQFDGREYEEGIGSLMNPSELKRI